MVKAGKHLRQPVSCVGKHVVLLVLEMQGVKRAVEHARSCTVVMD